MAEKSTYIKLDRNMENWRWWKNRNTLQVFIWLLFNANVQDHDFEGETIHRGEVATSFHTIAESCGLTFSEVRTALGHLKLTGELTIRRKAHYQVITIVSYSRYQDKMTNRSTNRSQSLDNQIAIKSQQYKNDKNGKNEKNIYGRSAPDSPSGDPPRGSAEWKASSHKRLKRDEGTVDDIPDEYRKDGWDDFGKYHDWRNQ